MFSPRGVEKGSNDELFLIGILELCHCSSVMGDDLQAIYTRDTVNSMIVYRWQSMHNCDMHFSCRTFKLGCSAASFFNSTVVGGGSSSSKMSLLLNSTKTVASTSDFLLILISLQSVSIDRTQ